METRSGILFTIDWDCTITERHMFCFLRSLTNPEANEFQKSLQGNKKKLMAFQKLVQYFHPFYENWGTKDPRKIQSLIEFMQNSIPLFSSDTNLIRDELYQFLFGSLERQQFISSFFEQITSLGSTDNPIEIVILTKGIGLCVYLIVREYFPHWFDYSLRIVDYAGIVFDPKTNIIQNTASISHKIPQIHGLINLDIQNSRRATSPLISFLIDDSFEDDLYLMSESSPVGLVQLGQTVSLPHRKGWPLYYFQHSEESFCLGGPKKNSTGLFPLDLEEIVQIIQRILENPAMLNVAS